MSSPTARTQTTRAWILMIVVAPALIIAITTLVAIVLVARAGGDQSVIGPGLRVAFPYIAMANHTLLFLIVVRLLRSDGLSLAEIGWNPSIVGRTWGREILIGMGAGIGLFVVQTYLSEPVVTWLRELAGTGSLRIAATPSLSLNVPGLIAGTVFAGVVEETTYRGYIQRQLSGRLGSAGGVVVATLGFAGLHWSVGPWSLAVIFVNGLLLALLMASRRALIAPVLAHAMVNALVILT